MRSLTNSKNIQKIAATLILAVSIFWIGYRLGAETSQADVLEGMRGFTLILWAIFLEALPFVMLGTIVSSLIQVFVTEDMLLRIMPNNKMLRLLFAGLIGLIFPVCECAIIPITRGLMKKGMPVGPAITFMLGGTANVNQSVGTGSGATISDNVSNLSGSFNQTRQQLNQLSQDLSQKTATGDAELKYSTLQLTGDGASEVQVFNIDSSDLANASGLALDTSIPADSYIILNVTGENASMSNQGQQALNLFSNRVIFNFIDAKVLSLSGISVQGTILAPYADVVGNNGNLEGTLIASSFSGTLEFHNNPFVPQPPDPGGTVPEPGTMLLLGPVMAGMYWWNRRRKRSKT